MGWKRNEGALLRGCSCARGTASWGSLKGSRSCDCLWLAACHGIAHEAQGKSAWCRYTRMCAGQDSSQAGWDTLHP